MSQFKKEIEILPAYDKRDPDPSKNYGIHSADLVFILKGKAGAITFRVFTGWYLPHVQKELSEKGNTRHLAPMGADVSYHSYVPKYDDHTPIKKCPYLDEKDCYCDGSGFEAERIFNILVEKGSDYVWKEMENWYYAHLEELEED